MCEKIKKAIPLNYFSPSLHVYFCGAMLSGISISPEVSHEDSH